MAYTRARVYEVHTFLTSAVKAREPFVRKIVITTRVLRTILILIEANVILLCFYYYYNNLNVSDIILGTPRSLLRIHQIRN